jgi:putative ABC transport system ATP-binding protein
MEGVADDPDGRDPQQRRGMSPGASRSRSAMIEAADVHKSFRSGDETIEALRGVSFQIPEGSCTFVVGPSGSGKSTLLYLLGALDQPTSGTIHVAGREVTAMSEAERDDYRRNRVGFVYQSFNLISNLSAVDNVLLPYIPTGLTPELRAKAENLLKDVGLGHRLNQRPHQMSGGEQQRVAIARALVKDPLVVFADEPTGNLDRAGGDRIVQLLRDRLSGNNATVVIVTHDRRFITPEDLVLEIEDGRLKGSPVTPVDSPARGKGGSSGG